MGVRPAIHVLTEMQVQRPIFTDSRAWEQKVTVAPNRSTEANFTLSEKEVLLCRGRGGACG